MERILVPLDGSELAERAVAPALALAARHGAAVHLASIVADLPPVPLAAPDADLVAQWFGGEERRAREYLDELKARLALPSGVVVTLHVHVGAVTRTLLELADSLEVDLLMLTTHGRGAWERAWLGSVADQLLRHSTRPLFVLKASGESPTAFEDESYPKHVLVPLDGSEGAEGVFEPLLPMLPRVGGRVTLMYVQHQPPPIPSPYLPHTVSEDALFERQREQMDAYLTDIATRIERDWSGEIESRVLTGGHPARNLIEFAKAQSVDLIALTTWGRGQVVRLILGSVADKLIRGTDVPILTVRR